MSVALLSTTIETQEIYKEACGLVTKKISKCNSYVAYNLRQIIADSSSPQCRTMHIRHQLQLFGRLYDFSFNKTLLSNCIGFINLLIKTHIFCLCLCKCNQLSSFSVLRSLPHLKVLPGHKVAKSVEESLMTTKTSGGLLVLRFFHKEGSIVIKRLRDGGQFKIT